MSDMLKNPRVLGGAVAAIGGVVALGIFQPDDASIAAMTTVVGICGGAAVGAVVAYFAKRFGGTPPAAK